MKTSQPQQVFDQYLVIQAAAGSPAAFEQLVRAWTPRLVRYASGHVGSADAARDIVQETWLAAIRGIRRIEDPASFPAWIYAIARRKCVDVIRVGQRRRRLTERVRQDALAGDEAGDVSPDPAERELATALSRLTEDQREAVTLYYGEELSIDEIATVVDVPTGTVKSRLFHARAALKKHLGEST